MAKKRSTRSQAKSVSITPQQSAPVIEKIERPVTNVLKDEHRTFSHVMHVLFLVSITITAYFTFQGFRVLSESEEYYGVLALLMLGWSWLFFEFGHRMHHKYD